MSASRRLNVALFGNGHMGRHHARHLAGEALVVVDPEQGLTPSLAELDCAVIAVPTSLHAEVAVPLLEAGIPCLVEKPLAATLEDARRLAAYPLLSVGHIERYNPAFRVMLPVDARFVQAERLAPFAGRSPDADVVLDLMVHDLDLFLALLPPEDRVVTEVRANGLAVRTGRVDIAHARVETAGGRVGVFTASRVSRAGARHFRVMAPGVYWSLNLGIRKAHRVRWGEEQLGEEPVEVPPGDALADELAAFLAAVRSGGPFPVPGADGLAALELALTIQALCQKCAS